jgi:hypothetical protein
MHGLRAATRFGNLFLLAIALLAAIGVAGLRRARPGRQWVAVAAIATVVLVNLEALRAPFGYRRWSGIPEIYRLLADEPGNVVLAEMPFYPPDAVFKNADYVLNSTAHWRPLMNGYSGYIPSTYLDVAGLLQYFPDARAFPSLNANGVTHIMIHPDRWGRDAPRIVEMVSSRPDLELRAVDENTGIRLYRYKPLP